MPTPHTLLPPPPIQCQNPGTGALQCPHTPDGRNVSEWMSSCSDPPRPGYAPRSDTDPQGPPVPLSEHGQLAAGGAMGRPIAMLLLLLLLPHGIGATTSQPPLLPCSCDAVGKAPDSCPSADCLCAMDHQPVNASDFHARECQGNVGMVAVAVDAVVVGVGVGVGLVVVGVVVGVVVWRCRRTTGTTGWGKREPPAAHGQPRYVSREAESSPAAVGVCLAPDYENVFVGSYMASSAAPVQDGEHGCQQGGYSPQAPPDDLYFMESDAGEQPIYANTGTPREDIYVSPDP
ncbi:leucine-rich repeat-containing protein 25 [Meleagris gallopavo]|uniref:leucine-rich repeat-containing protein 25 n=1 Tax=Meleagris gallopavo TaxID=9103 RepID=UPI00093C4213|nr:leucine-rich repeat-containing protein 25 [Meleagris gallopavo]